MRRIDNYLGELPLFRPNLQRIDYKLRDSLFPAETSQNFMENREICSFRSLFRPIPVSSQSEILSIIGLISWQTKSRAKDLSVSSGDFEQKTYKLAFSAKGYRFTDRKGKKTHQLSVEIATERLISCHSRQKTYQLADQISGKRLISFQWRFRAKDF